ncbi:hypothetical protein GGR44_001621 [Sphingobium fontiphilum]|uniref:Uncharacterized protein n=1 Tax=Sphingobium fontiphilum TaxID=944425 RepID=A0A7W6GNW7_9SPHN|nr:hypothetical protein [Sphingobium fontiphilum]
MIGQPTNLPYIDMQAMDTDQCFARGKVAEYCASAMIATLSTRFVIARIPQRWAGERRPH